MYYHGFTKNAKKSITNALIIVFINLTHNKEWSTYISNEITINIHTFISSLIHTNIWYTLYNNISKHKLCELIYKIIETKLCDIKYWPSLLDTIPLFTCIKCKKIDNIINYDNLCVNCQQ